MNTVVLFVPQQEAWVVERMGRFHRILEPVAVRVPARRGRCCGMLTDYNGFVGFFQGLNFLIPILDRIRYVQSLKEIVIDVPEQSAVSLGLYQTPLSGGLKSDWSSVFSPLLDLNPRFCLNR